MTEEHSLLTGSVPKKLAVFAFPLLLANILQSFYNVVDMLVVGQIVGDTGLAAIGNASKLCYIINSICIGMTMGGAVLIAQYKGANDKKGQLESFQMLALLSLVSSLLVTIVSLATYQPLFKMLNVPADAYQDACDYMKIICCGTVFVFGYNAVCSVLKGLGDSKSPLYFVGIATIINVVLDIMVSYLKKCDIPVEIYQYDPKAPDDLFETFKSNWTRITYEQKKQMLKTKKRIETIDSAVFSEYVHSMIALIDYPGIGIKSMESCFDFVMNMREEQTLFGNR